MRVVFGRWRDAEVIGLFRLVTAQISLTDCALRRAQIFALAEVGSPHAVGSRTAVG